MYSSTKKIAQRRYPKLRLRTRPRRPVGRPKTEDVAALEARLVDVARKTFILHGYGATSINQIAKAARISKNTLYARFPSKAALFQGIMRDQIARVNASIPPSPRIGRGSLEDRLFAYFDTALSQSLTHEILQINRLIISESYRFPELGELARMRAEVGVMHVAQIIQECAKADGVPCRDPHGVAATLLRSIHGWYTIIMTENRVVSDEERVAAVRNVIRLFVKGRSAW